MSELDEVNHLLSIATFPGVKDLLQKYAAQLNSAEDTEKPIPGDPSPATPAPQEPDTVFQSHTLKSDAKPIDSVNTSYVPPLPAGASYIPINDFAWDQVCPHPYLSFSSPHHGNVYIGRIQLWYSNSLR